MKLPPPIALRNISWKRWRLKDLVLIQKCVMPAFFFLTLFIQLQNKISFAVLENLACELCAQFRSVTQPPASLSQGKEMWILFGLNPGKWENYWVWRTFFLTSLSQLLIPEKNAVMMHITDQICLEIRSQQENPEEEGEQGVLPMTEKNLKARLCGVGSSG